MVNRQGGFMAVSKGQGRRESKKHPVLWHIFQKYFDSRNPQKLITFYLSDISEGYAATNQAEPVSISNTILDLCRQDRGINSRVPIQISDLGYDLRKKTGQDTEGKKFAGEFVYVGVGNALQSWLVWPENPEIFEVDSNQIPEIVKALIRRDEGALFSVIDYTDFLSELLHKRKHQVIRVQNPMKWQPNEIDGFYTAVTDSGIVVYPIEAKALTTGDEINLDQLKGGYETVVRHVKTNNLDVTIVPIAAKMIKNGVLIGIFAPDEVPVEPQTVINVQLVPKLENWN